MNRKIIELKYSEKRPENLLSLLKGNVFHVTRRELYEQIIQDGRINNNKDGKYGLNSSSQNSFGRNNGYICFFDLREQNFDRISRTIEWYYDFLGPTWFEIIHADYCEFKMAYFILREKYHSNLIVYKDVSLKGKLNHAVPHTEAWIEDHVPLEWIATIYLVTICYDAPEEGTLPRIHHDLAVNDLKNKSS